MHFYVRIFYPNASSNRSTDPYRRYKQAKKCEYGQHVREVECDLFSLVLSTTSYMGREAMTFYKRLADMISKKRQHPYPVVTG